MAASLTLLLNTSTSLMRIKEEDISRVWPYHFRWSPTATVDALVFATCSMNFTLKGLALSPMQKLSQPSHWISYPIQCCLMVLTGLWNGPTPCFLKTFVNFFWRAPTLNRDAGYKLPVICQDNLSWDPQYKSGDKMPKSIIW